MSEMNAMSVEIAKLTLRSGDVLIVKCDAFIDRQVADRIRESVLQNLPEGTNVLVLDRTMSVAVLTRKEIEARVAA